jgi:hypothetical protein
MALSLNFIRRRFQKNISKTATGNKLHKTKKKTREINQGKCIEIYLSEFTD